jgi:DNA-3-methyladenine glycosylase II
MPTFTIRRPRGFELGAAKSFYAGFVPGSGMAPTGSSADSPSAPLTLAFRLDRTFEAAAVELREEGDALVGELAGSADVVTARAQIARMLGLDADGEAWAALGEREPVVGRLQAENPGFFTAAKPSPYDAAVWAILVPRMNMRQAARVKLAMARELGDAVTLAGRVHHVFPAPSALVRLESFAGVADEKVARLRGIGEAAVAGRLGADRLLALGEREAVRELQELRGVGPWAASHIYYRGAAPCDGLPSAEPRVLHGLADAYGIAPPDEAKLEELAEAWRPFRMWVCVLLSRHLARTAGWRAPELARERAVAGRKLARRLEAAAG